MEFALWQRVRVVKDDVAPDSERIGQVGVITEVDTPSALPYRVLFEDGDHNFYRAGELEAASTMTVIEGVLSFTFLNDAMLDGEVIDWQLDGYDGKRVRITIEEVTP